MVPSRVSADPASGTSAAASADAIIGPAREAALAQLEQLSAERADLIQTISFLVEEHRVRQVSSRLARDGRADAVSRVRQAVAAAHLLQDRPKEVLLATEDRIASKVPDLLKPDLHSVKRALSVLQDRHAQIARQACDQTGLPLDVFEELVNTLAPPLAIPDRLLARSDGGDDDDNDDLAEASADVERL